MKNNDDLKKNKKKKSQLAIFVLLIVAVHYRNVLPPKVSLSDYGPRDYLPSDIFLNENTKTEKIKGSD